MTRIDLSMLRPPGGTPARSVDTAGDSQAWRREMERAQMTDWFHGPLALRTGAAGEDSKDATDETATASPALRVATPEMPNGPPSISFEPLPAERQPLGSAPRLTTLQRRGVGVDPRATRLDSPSRATAPAIGTSIERPQSANTPPARAPELAIDARRPLDPAVSASAAAPRVRRRMELPSTQAHSMQSSSGQARSGMAHLHAALQAQLAPSVRLAPLAPLAPAPAPAASAAAIPSSPAVQIPVSPPLQAPQHAPTQSCAPTQTNAALVTSPLPARGPSSFARGPQESSEFPAARAFRAASPASRDAQPQAVRATAMWEGDQGVHLWLGVDASGLAELVPLMRSVESWLRSQGVRLLGVTCNGRRWPDSSHSSIQSQEEP
jgi:hypothetical protein